MKALMMILAILISLTAVAAEECKTYESDEIATEQMEIKTDVPNHLKGATITVTLADGKSTTVPAEKFKVVPRKQQFLVTKTSKSKTLSCTNTIKDPNKNRVSLLGGAGPTGGLKTSNPAPYTTQVDSETGAVGGLQYQRLLTEKLSVGVQAQTNKGGSLMIGIDF